MPIVEDENGRLYYDYDMPDDIKRFITKEFADEFIKQFALEFKMSKNRNWVKFFRKESQYYCATHGSYIALKKTSEILGCSELLEYYETLEWYDSDMFNCELYDIVCRYQTER